MIAIISAADNAIPSVFVLPQTFVNDALMQGTPDDSLELTHTSGWMPAESFDNHSTCSNTYLFLKREPNHLNGQP